MAEKALLDVANLSQIDLQKGENLTAEFAARQSFKKVPVMEFGRWHGGGRNHGDLPLFLRKSYLIRRPHYWVTTALEKTRIEAVAALD